MTRVCKNKQDLRSARERWSRNRRKRERGRAVENVKIVLVCNPCGTPIREQTLPSGGELRGIVVEEVNDILCLQHAFKSQQRKEPDLSIADFMERLRPSNWNAKPWNPAFEPEEEKAPYLYICVRAVAAPVIISLSA